MSVEAADTTRFLAADRPHALRLIERIAQRTARRQPVAREQEQLGVLVAQSQAKVAARAASVPLLTYPGDLPVVAQREVIATAIAAHQVVIVCGETGSGKTTQLPKILLGLGRGCTGLIGHTQPRRIAARSVAQRIADELKVELGGLVGFKVRFSDRSASNTLVKVMTDGILLAEMREDPDLLRYDTLIIDEAHERSLNIDFLLGYLRGLLVRRPDLKLVITSATIDPGRFAEYFGGAPIIQVEGRSFAIETRYRPPGADDDDAFDVGLSASIVAAVGEILSERSDIGRGDMLVFLPGEREIRETADYLTQAYGGRLDVLPLYSRLSWAEQQRVFDRQGRQRVVLSTNVAETSLTVPGIRSVIDAGLARISRYSPRAKIQRLPVEPVSQASADQRRGRCGRVGTGLCIRLYSEEDYNLRPASTPPEVLRTNLASVILQMEVLGLGSCGDFPFMDPPETRLVNDGYRLLQELQAVDDDRFVTAHGKAMARLPVDPRFARMLVAAQGTGALQETLILSAVLSLQDPRERPPDQPGTADERHAVWADQRSDFITLLNLWAAYQSERASLSKSALRRWCAAQFLSATRMREWEELLSQLSDVVRDLGWVVNTEPANYENLHKALLCGLLGQIGLKEEGSTVRGEYRGPRGLKFLIAPGSALKSRTPRYIVCAQIVETQRIYARVVAAVEPEWIEWAGRHLLKQEYTEPTWDPSRGVVNALQAVTLFGLVLIAGRRVNYGRVAPIQAREIFVREALVHGRSRLNAAFFKHNAALKQSLIDEEAAIRRHEILVDETVEAQFYLDRLPVDAHSLAAFDTWRKQAERTQPQLLFMKDQDLRRPESLAVDRSRWPQVLPLGVNVLPVSYRFDPQSTDDGATLVVPAPLVETLDPGELEWGIPGWRREKITEIIRGLPKAQRRHLVPAPDVAARADQEMESLRDQPFYSALSQALTRVSGQSVPVDMLSAVEVPAHLRLHLSVVAADEKVVATSRDLREVRRAMRGTVQAPIQSPVQGQEFERNNIRSWEWQTLPESVQVTRQGVRLELYPVIIDQKESAGLTLVADAIEAQRLHRLGVLRLLCMEWAGLLRNVKRDLAADRDLMLLHQSLGPAAELPVAMSERAVARVCLPADIAAPRSRESFEAAQKRGQAQLVPTVERLNQRVRETLKLYLEISQQISHLSAALDQELVADMKRSLQRLVYPGFVAGTPDPWLDSLPRFCRALQRRVTKLPGARGAVADAHYDFRERWKRHDDLCKTALKLDPNRLPDAVTQWRWLIEEYVVSVFAQDLKTSVTVSPKRLSDAEALARRAVDALR